jgi:hypothetical protein
MKQRGFRYCLWCQGKLQKRSKTAAGTQRWQCVTCGKSMTLGRPDLTRRFVFERFISWLLGKASQTELAMSARTFRDQTMWCWGVPVPFVLSGEIQHCVIVDGIRVGGMVCLIARTVDYVIAWRWVPYESSVYWAELLCGLPASAYVVCDGQKGLLKALATCWPDTIVQRCRFHAWLNVKAKLTLHPESKAAQELLELTRNLLHVRSRKQARQWKRQLKRWHRKHGMHLNERTVKVDPKLRERRWRYTHERLRSAYRQIHKIQHDLLRSSFHASPGLPSTTNHVEGGINSQIRSLLKTHRGMSKEHQRKLVDWYLYTRTEDPKPPRFCL